MRDIHTIVWNAHSKIISPYYEEDVGFERKKHYFKKTYLSELALRNTIAVHNDSVGLVTSCGLVKHHQMIFDHGGQIIDDFGPEKTKNKLVKLWQVTT